MYPHPMNRQILLHDHKVHIFQISTLHMYYSHNTPLFPNTTTTQTQFSKKEHHITRCRASAKVQLCVTAAAMSTSNPPQLSLLLTLPLALVLATSVLATTTQATASQPPNPTRPSNGSTQHKEPAAILGRYLTTNNQRQAYVSGGSLISFGENLLAQEKADILDSLLFAELSAGDVYNRNTNFLSWYKLYMEVLRETGWQVAGFSLEPYNAPQNSYFKLANMVIDFLKPKCHSTQQEVSGGERVEMRIDRK